MALEISFHLLALTKLFAEVPCCSNDPQIFQFRRVQFVRQRLKIVRYFGGLVSQIAYSPTELRFRVRNILLDSAELYRQERESLDLPEDLRFGSTCVGNRAGEACSPPLCHRISKDRSEVL